MRRRVFIERALGAREFALACEKKQALSDKGRCILVCSINITGFLVPFLTTAKQGHGRNLYGREMYGRKMYGRNDFP